MNKENFPIPDKDSGVEAGIYSVPVEVDIPHRKAEVEAKLAEAKENLKKLAAELEELERKDGAGHA